MSLRHLAVNRRGDEADDSDSSDSISPVRVPQRASTVSPSTRQSSFRRFARRRSDFNLSSATSERKKEKERRNSQARYSVERKRGNLRKTNSEPSVEHAAQIDIEAIRQLLLTLPKFSASSTLNPLSNPVSDAEEINTEIEELRDAAKSIQSLQRVLKGSGKTAIDRTGSQSENDSSTVAESASEGRVSGISTRGHPRGVMQFLSSIRQDRLPDGIEMRRGFSRKGSAPEAFPTMDVLRPIRKGDKSPRSTRRRAVCEELYPAGDLLEKGSTALAEVSRFSRLLDSLRMDGRGQQEEREKTETEHPSISWSPYLLAPPDGEQSEPGLNPEDSLMEADLLLWKKRSRASLRRHNSMRTLAARELFDTEKSFVEGLEYLVQKYMRPLRRPLEITLIEAGLVDKIFYKIPEILAHHQVLLSSLSNRLESWHAESSVGDVLLVHFSKQSMIETYISFVDNFKYAKAALAQARQKPAFEKYYQRCCRDHRNKLDLDALLISPIQRVPRYELILNQLLKHTSIEHADHEKMLRAQRHIHQLAVAINRQQQQNEQAEQRLREIEAIVDGLEDLVTTGRTLLRYDMVTMKGRDGHRQRCVFTCSDQLIVTSVRRKDHRLGRRPIIQSSDFLDSNRFKLLIKISLTDVEIGKDTLAKLQETERSIEVLKEDLKVLKKVIELCSLLRTPHEVLATCLSDLEASLSRRVRSLSEQLSSNPDLTTVVLNVATSNGVETVPIEFASADRRTQWETAFKEAKTALVNHQADGNPVTLQSILAHQTRPGLQFCAATVVPGKRADSAPFVWACTSDKFSGQVAVLSVENEPAIESCAGIGNAAVSAIATVPPASRARKRSLFRMERSVDKLSRDESVLDLNSSESSSSDSDDEGPTTVWIGNDDGEVFLLNSCERVRNRIRDRVARLSLPIRAICPSHAQVFVSAGNSSQSQLVAFRSLNDNSWDLEHPSNINLPFTASADPMVAVARGLCLAAAHQLYILDPDTHMIERSSSVLLAGETISSLCVSGALLFVAAARSSSVWAVDAFSLAPLNQFSIAPIIQAQLAGREDILREHKLGCLRVSTLVAFRSLLWIGTSSGFILSTPTTAARAQTTPPITVLEVGHAGPCRVLLPIPIQQVKKTKKMSLSLPPQQNSQILFLSCGEGLDDAKGTSHDPIGDPTNHLIFWRA